MRKILLVISLLSISLLNAQKFGVKAGYSYKLKRDKGRLDNPGNGFDLGVYYTYCFDDYYMLTIQPELIFSSQKHRIIDTYADGNGYEPLFDGTKNANVNFITVPLMIQYNSADLNSRHAYIEMGPIFHYLLNYKGDFIYQEKLYEMRSEYLNKFSIDFGMGIGYNFSKHLEINMRWIMGVSNFFNSDNFLKETQKQGDQRIAFPSLQFSLGYKF